MMEPADHESRPKQGSVSSVQSIRRAFAVLDALNEGPLGVTEVADRAALPKSTAARLLATLVGEGAVEQVPGETSYRLGPRLVMLAGGFSLVRSLAAVGRPVLADLAAASGEAAGLGVPDGDLVHYIDQVDTPNPVVVRDWTGARAPLHAVSSGQVLLAFRTPAAIERYIAQPTLERFTPSHRKPAVHRGPKYPAAQSQVIVLTPSMQVPPFLHGAPRQSSMSWSHLGPV